MINDEAARRGGDEAAQEAHLPSPSIWPAALAAGLTLLFFGLLTNYAFCAFGAALMAYALRGWIGELRHDE